MRTETIKITVPGGDSEKANAKLFLHELSGEILIEKRPVIIVCPGGGYGFTSDREADPVALEFMRMGYHVAVLRYSVAPFTYPSQLLEAKYLYHYLVENADSLNIDTEKIFVCGFSAGAHLAATLGTDSDATIKLAGMILCYPVITSGEFAHRGSFDNLLGEKKNDQASLDMVSIEKRVTGRTPKTFIWTTYTDPAVPMENSLMMADALRKNDVPFELHIFSEGNHGLSLATEQTSAPGYPQIEENVKHWVAMCERWIKTIL